MTTSDTGQKLNATHQGYLRIEQVNGYMVLFDGTVNRMIIGILPDGTVGIVVSKEGIDVFSAFS